MTRFVCAGVEAVDASVTSRHSWFDHITSNFSMLSYWHPVCRPINAATLAFATLEPLCAVRILVALIVASVSSLTPLSPYLSAVSRPSDAWKDRGQG